uniref:Uncharacterized protein n=1 Tax=Anguilla anguilla TaxID=7936 RepID=A0A0E9VZD5_ANGAN
MWTHDGFVSRVDETLILQWFCGYVIPILTAPYSYLSLDTTPL